jgi:hypothetical protein
MQISGLSDIVNITEYFLGEDDGNYNFQCLHGPDECQGDIIELCAQWVTESVSQWGWWNMGVCMQADYDNIPDNAAGCAKQAGLNWTAINHCVNDGMGDKLLEQSFQDSADIDSAPTIMIGGQEASDCENGDGCLEAVCSAYTGPPPSGCSSVLLNKKNEQKKEYKPKKLRKSRRV